MIKLIDKIRTTMNDTDKLNRIVSIGLIIYIISLSIALLLR